MPVSKPKPMLSPQQPRSAPPHHLLPPKKMPVAKPKPKPVAPPVTPKPSQAPSLDSPAETNQKKDDKTEEIEKLCARIESSKARAAKLKEEVVTLQEEEE